MANGNGDVWKWISTTLGGALIGAMAFSVLSMGRIEAQSIRFRDHELEPMHVGGVAVVAAIEADNAEMKAVLERIEAKIDRFHEARE